MADQIPASEKARTISHMNKDHRRDMRLILQHYGSVPPAPSSYAAVSKKNNNPENHADPDPDPDSDPIMTDIDLTSFTVRLPSSSSSSSSSSSTTTHAIAFDPPLAAWDERRPRLVEMTRSARSAILGPATVTVAEYVPPRGAYELTIFVLVLELYAAFALLRAGFLAPGTVLGRLVEALTAFVFPSHGLGGFVWLVETLIAPVVALHVAEAWWLERSRLRRFGVARGGRVWWLWMGSVSVEGFMAFKRFDELVERLKAKGQ